MDAKLQNKLYEKYPKIFRGKDSSIQLSFMPWGICTENGWYWLIDELCSALQWDTDYNKQPQIVATQVKEKFGTLRFYTQGESERQWGMIALAQSMSVRICEVCGATKSVKLCGKMWVKTLCERCHTKRTQVECQT